MKGLAVILALLAAGSLALLAFRLGPRGPEGAGRSTTLHFLAAASLDEPLREIADAFEDATPGVSISVGHAGSNQLLVQLEHGAPCDVLLTADRATMEAAADAGLVDPGTRRELASGRLCLLIPRGARSRVGSLADAARPGVRLVVADEGVPAGRLTRLLLERAGDDASLGAGFAAAVEQNIVSREPSVAGVVARVALGEVDAGLGYASSARGAHARGVLAIDLPESFELRAEYVGAVATHAREPELARGFLRFVSTASSRAILERHGFELPPEGAPARSVP